MSLVQGSSGWQETHHKGAVLSLLVSICLNAVAFLLIKSMVVLLELESGVGWDRLLFFALGTPYLWIGGAAFLGSMYFWVISLKNLDLSIAYPTASFSYVIVAIFSSLVFGESLTATRIIGMALVMVGIYIMYRPGQRMDEANR